MASLNIDALLSRTPSVQLDALTHFAANLSHTPNPATEHPFATLLETVARLNPNQELRVAIISMPHFPRSALPKYLKDDNPNIRNAALQHRAITTSDVLQHLVYETNEHVIITCLSALQNISDEQALEALGVKDTDPCSRDEFYSVLRQCTEHHSHSVRVASARPIVRLLQSNASEAAFAILEHLLCDVTRVACAAVDAMLEISHKFKLSERVVRALISLSDAGEKSALRLLCNVPCKTISTYAYLEFYMERKVYNATSEGRQEMNDFFTGIVVRNENFARVLDFGREYPDKQWFWRGERHDT